MATVGVKGLTWLAGFRTTEVCAQYQLMVCAAVALPSVRQLFHARLLSALQCVADPTEVQFNVVAGGRRPLQARNTTDRPSERAPDRRTDAGALYIKSRLAECCRLLPYHLAVRLLVLVAFRPVLSAVPRLIYRSSLSRLASACRRPTVCRVTFVG